MKTQSYVFRRTWPFDLRCIGCTFAWPLPWTFLWMILPQIQINKLPFKAFQAFHLAFSYNKVYKKIITVKANIPGAGILQSPMVACLYKAYPASLSSLETVLAGVQVRTNSAVSWNFFYGLWNYITIYFKIGHDSIK